MRIYEAREWKKELVYIVMWHKFLDTYSNSSRNPGIDSIKHWQWDKKEIDNFPCDTNDWVKIKLKSSWYRKTRTFQGKYQIDCEKKKFCCSGKVKTHFCD
jgi:hypothetical protein